VKELLDLHLVFPPLAQIFCEALVSSLPKTQNKKQTTITQEQSHVDEIRKSIRLF